MSDNRDDDAAILHEAVRGRPIREIAKARGMLVSEVNRVLDLQAQHMFSGESTRRQMLLEASRLNDLKQALFERYMTEGDNPSAALYIKASERLSSLCGWNHPIGHAITLTGHLEREPEPTSTAKMLAALQTLRDSDPHKAERDAFNEHLRLKDAAAARASQEPPSESD